MAYHSVLKTSEDYYGALREARNICNNLTSMVREKTGNSEITIFPYRYNFVLYPTKMTKN
jgi:hypothetical protein